MPSIAWNKKHWTASLALHHRDPQRDYAYGDQWGAVDASPVLQVVRDAWLLPFVGPERTTLEIGTGGGRWTRYLLNAQHLYSVDVNPTMLQYTAQRFAGADNLSLLLTDGASLEGIPARTVDFVFSFGTFVHIDPPQIIAYLAQLRPLLRPGADVVLQYADKSKPMASENIHFVHTDPVWMEDLLCTQGYHVVRHSTDLLPHSNLSHARPSADPAPEPWPLATDAPVRLLAWPDYRSPEEMVLLFQRYGAALATQGSICLCLRRDPTGDLSAEAARQIVEEAFALTVRQGHLDVLFVEEPLEASDWGRLGASVSAILDLPSATWGRRAALLSRARAPRVRSVEELLRVLPA